MKASLRLIAITICCILFLSTSVSFATISSDSVWSWGRFSFADPVDFNDISVAHIRIGDTIQPTDGSVAALRTEITEAPTAILKPSKSAAAPASDDSVVFITPQWRNTNLAGLETGYVTADGITRADISTPVELLGLTSQLYKVTFYCACMECCGKTNAITASMEPAVAGITVAADRAIPFGTRIWIEGYGERIVQDRGGAIGVNRLDIYVNTHSEALSHGTKMKQVWFL